MICDTVYEDESKGDLTLKRINKKGQQIKGKVTKGKYNYNGPIEF